MSSHSGHSSFSSHHLNTASTTVSSALSPPPSSRDKLEQLDELDFLLEQKTERLIERGVLKSPISHSGGDGEQPNCDYARQSAVQTRKRGKRGKVKPAHLSTQGGRSQFYSLPSNFKIAHAAVALRDAGGSSVHTPHLGPATDSQPNLQTRRSNPRTKRTSSAKTLPPGFKLPETPPPFSPPPNERGKRRRSTSRHSSQRTSSSSSPPSPATTLPPSPSFSSTSSVSSPQSYHSSPSAMDQPQSTETTTPTRSLKGRAAADFTHIGSGNPSSTALPRSRSSSLNVASRTHEQSPIASDSRTRATTLHIPSASRIVAHLRNVNVQPLPPAVTPPSFASARPREVTSHPTTTTTTATTLHRSPASQVCALLQQQDTLSSPMPHRPRNTSLPPTRVRSDQSPQHPYMHHHRQQQQQQQLQQQQQYQFQGATGVDDSQRQQHRHAASSSPPLSSGFRRAPSSASSPFTVPHCHSTSSMFQRQRVRTDPPRPVDNHAVGTLNARNMSHGGPYNERTAFANNHALSPPCSLDQFINTDAELERLRCVTARLSDDVYVTGAVDAKGGHIPGNERCQAPDPLHMLMGSIHDLHLTTPPAQSPVLPDGAVLYRNKYVMYPDDDDDGGDHDDGNDDDVEHHITAGSHTSTTGGAGDGETKGADYNSRVPPPSRAVASDFHTLLSSTTPPLVSSSSSPLLPSFAACSAAYVTDYVEAVLPRPSAATATTAVPVSAGIVVPQIVRPLASRPSPRRGEVNSDTAVLESTTPSKMPCAEAVETDGTTDLNVGVNPALVSSGGRRRFGAPGTIPVSAPTMLGIPLLNLSELQMATCGMASPGRPNLISFRNVQPSRHSAFTDYRKCLSERTPVPQASFSAF